MKKKLIVDFCNRKRLTNNTVAKYNLFLEIFVNARDIK
ncbi:hypothetical protein SAMN05443549_101127 [Flavobacterium fluvii]|uniref:Integrase n=1 Tax=Flavobacterium fluvii TaxID=468056 RepID=A0A1M5DZE6_9FLAO|nr:hypothetical protein SAMN05443549_101127 [Flavobacterium fluvii]